MAAEANGQVIWVSRILFLVTLCFVAVVLGVVSHNLLTQAEVTLAEEQFQSIASRAALTASRIVRRKMRGTSVLSSLIAHAHPQTDPWPFVTVDGFEDISNKLIVSTDAKGMFFAPFVEHSSLSDFEDFAYTFFNSTAGISSFGKGVWGLDDSLEAEDRRYHDNEVKRDYESQNEFFAPVLQHSAGPSSLLMLNLRFEETRGKAIDSLVACVTENTSPSCAEITSVIELADSEQPSPGALLMDPIRPIDGSTATGVVLSTLVWEELFENVFSDEVSGIYCVLESDETSLTYVIENGIAYLQHSVPSYFQDNFEKYKTTVHLTPEDLFDKNSPQYTLSLYPSERFFDVYSTNNPRLAAVGAFVAIGLTSLLFILYDYFVRKEFTNKTELLEAKRQFMRWVCHEVRTPLNSLCLGLSIVCSELRSKIEDDGSRGVDESATTNDEIEEWLGLTTELQTNANIAVDVLSDLLNYDKIERGHLALELSVFHLADLVENTANEFRLPALGRNVNFEVKLSENANTTTCGDRVRLAHVLRNIVSNGLKFTPEGGSLTISIKTHMYLEPKARRSFDLQNGRRASMYPIGSITVSVADTGAGMTADQIKKLFRDGVQFDVNNLQDGNGSGLGLYISKGIIDEHGGSMFVESAGLGKGTTMSFKLPIFDCDDETVKPSASGSDSATESLSALKNSDRIGNGDLNFPPKSLNILVVDDSMSNRKLLMRTLSKMGHRCVGAEDGAVAVRMVRESMKSNPFDSVLLDFEMPIQNGPSAAAEIRSMGCDTCIVGVTGNVLAEDVQHFQQMGADEVLPKPLSMPNLEALWVDYGLVGGTGRLSETTESRKAACVVENMV